MWNDEMKEQGKRNDLCSNPTEVRTNRGKAYTVSRLKQGGRIPGEAHDR